MKRAAIYARCSTQHQDTELQIKELSEFAKARGWSFTIYEDAGFTGTNANRPMLKKLLQDTSARKIDVVICWKLDRLFRSLKHMILTLQDFTDLGVEFISVRDNVDLSTSSGRLMMHLIAAFAEFEAALIKERVRAGMANAKAKGVRFGRPKNTDDNKIKTLRSTGLSYRSIAKELGISLASVQRGIAAKERA